MASGKKIHRLRCLRRDAEVGEDRTAPLFIGFESASVLMELAEAPAFGEKDSHSLVSAQLKPETSKWQRPLDKGRVKEISNHFRKSKVGEERFELMPNPVLLALKPEVNPSLKKFSTSGGGEIEIRHERNAKPLWILDGQHRINGLAQSEQSDNPLPFVLLMNEPGGDNAYTTGIFAKIFAEITTKSEAIEDLHREWLSYAFDINEYDVTAHSSAERVKAMQTTRRLCEANFPKSLPYNGIQFNPALESSTNAFAWENQRWVDALLNSYFKVADETDVDQLAKAISTALSEFRKAMSDPEGSVLFGRTEGTKGAGRVPFQEGVIVAVLQWLAEDPERIETDWSKKAKDLRLNRGDWNLGGKGGVVTGPSRTIVTEVFRKGLEGDVPGSLSIPEWLECKSDTWLQLEVTPVHANGKTIKGSVPEAYPLMLSLGDPDDQIETQVPLLGPSRIRVIQHSANVTQIKYADQRLGAGAEPITGKKFLTRELKGAKTSSHVMFSARGYGEIVVYGAVNFKVST